MTPIAVFTITSHLPDFVIPYFEILKDTMVSLLQKIGIVPEDNTSAGEVEPVDIKSIINLCELLSADSSRARQVLTDAERELENLKSDKEKTESDALEIFNDHGFGAEGEWKKLDGTCLEKDTGEYV